ncbi:hypothetical protein LPJ66_009423 [Kickxella alabastrina]|uniref:Uncharacterized protein n=1 Tax=Kickxella alabastrina TaxID=61397 RepID=A0ACC1I3L1_9FUNG|nr:hypothetical protein LPJ66_009423 [Kickxella alabastrina]
MGNNSVEQTDNISSITQHTVDELAQYVVNKLTDISSSNSEHPQKRLIIAVSGTPGSGKTHLSKLISSSINAQMPSHPSIVLPMDGFHLTKAQLLAMPDPQTAMRRRGAPWTFDSHGFVELVLRVREQYEDPVLAPSFDHAIGDPMADAIVITAQHRVVFIEGLYAHVSEDPWAQLAHIVDERWWVEPQDREGTRERLVSRHLATGLAADKQAAVLRIDGNDGINGEYSASHRLSPTRVIFN